MHHQVWDAGYNVPEGLLLDSAQAANKLRRELLHELTALPDEWTTRLPAVQQFRRGYLRPEESNRLRARTNWSRYRRNPYWRNFIRGRPWQPET